MTRNATIRGGNTSPTFTREFGRYLKYAYTCRMKSEEEITKYYAKILKFKYYALFAGTALAIFAWCMAIFG